MKERGITLIALVITVIILLILAGVAVSIGLNGDNLFAKANEAKTEWNDKVTENNEELENLTTILNTLVEEDTVTADKINSRIGDIINYNSPEESGYTGDWQIFYATDNEVFIIAKEVVDLNTTLSESKVLSNGSNYSYEGSKDIRENYANHRNSNGLGYDYGSRYNSRWLAACEAHGSERESGNAVYTAYMCDPDNWIKYVTGKASYAVGGMTMELLELSLYETTGQSDVIGELILTPEYIVWNKIKGYGYDHDLYDLDYPYSAEYNYFFASPAYEDDTNWYMYGYENSYENRTTDMPIGYNNTGIRPVVSIPISEIQIENENVFIK